MCRDFLLGILIPKTIKKNVATINNKRNVRQSEYVFMSVSQSVNCYFKKKPRIRTEFLQVVRIIMTLQTKYYATKILNTETDRKCRFCQKFDETIDHLISVFPILAKEQYIKRLDRVCAQLHFNICKEAGVQLDKKHWYEHVPNSVETSQGGKVTILWN